MSYSFVHNQNGSLNLQTPKGLVHSKIDPSKEAERFLSSIRTTSLSPNQSTSQVTDRSRDESTAQSKDHSTVQTQNQSRKEFKKESAKTVIVGLGAGLVVDLSAKFFSKSDIYFYEPVPEISQLLHSKGKIEQWLKDGFRIIPDLSDAKDARVVINPVYTRLFPEYLPTNNVDNSTLNRFAREWWRNILTLFAHKTELLYLNELEKGKSMKHSFKSVTFFGASPTLIDDMHQAKKSGTLQESLLVSSDTALAPLIAIGIEPHLVVSTDAGRGTYFHFLAAVKVSPKTFPLLTWAGGAKCLRLFSTNVFYYASTFPLDQILAASKGITILENESRNPAGLALSLAKLLRINEVRMLGVSFISKGTQSHERGTGYCEYHRARLNRVTSLESTQPKGYLSDRFSAKGGLAKRGLESMAATMGLQLTFDSEVDISGSSSKSVQRGHPPGEDANSPVHGYFDLSEYLSPVSVREWKDSLESHWPEIKTQFVTLKDTDRLFDKLKRLL